MRNPDRVLITGGHELGGLASVAAGLAAGFAALGIPAEVVSLRGLLAHARDLRDPGALKVLSTEAVFAAPGARRAICVAHGLPCADTQGWRRLAGIVASFKLANAAGAPLVAVSEYTAVHLRNIFNVRVDAVIRNPLKPLYLEAPGGDAGPRPFITYAGRLHPAKNIHRLLPAICDLLAERPDLRASIVGAGQLRERLVRLAGGDPRVEFQGSFDDRALRDRLRRTRVFVSGNCTEGLGVTYLEALSQGAAVAMPASGGGLELALDEIGESLHLLPLSLERGAILAALRRAADARFRPPPLAGYAASAVAAAYLEVDARRDSGDRQSFGDRNWPLPRPAEIPRRAPASAALPSFAHSPDGPTIRPITRPITCSTAAIQAETRTGP